jgi:hypothetical protein
MTEQTTKPKGTFAKLMASSPLQEEPKRSHETTPQPLKTPAPAGETQAQRPAPGSELPPASQKKELLPSRDTMTPRHHDTMQPRNHDTTPPRQELDIIEVVRKAVKQIGKEAATHRFTLEEKHLLADIEYTYKRQGIRTSENEITRIAINYFLGYPRKAGHPTLSTT